jgi:hypothetical protein
MHCGVVECSEALKRLLESNMCFKKLVWKKSEPMAESKQPSSPAAYRHPLEVCEWWKISDSS